MISVMKLDKKLKKNENVSKDKPFHQYGLVVCACS